MDAIDSGDTAWVLAPGVGFFYGGLAGQKNVLSVLLGSLLSVSVVSIQWFIWGYSLSFSTSGGDFIGDFKWAGLGDIASGLPHPAAPHIPHVVFMLYQCVFATGNAAIAFGGGMERVRFLPFCVFIFIWSTLVYDVVAYWTLGPGGWFRNMGALDYAGGTPVHITSGFSGIVFAYFVGHRKMPAKPHNITFVILGTVMMWFGWFGFNGGSALGANARAGNACLLTMLAASWGALAWGIFEYKDTKKISATGFCAGALAALVCITPASGFVEPASVLAFSSASGCLCYYGTRIKTLLKIDDVADTLAGPGIAAVIGNILTGIFSTKKIIALDGTCTDTDRIPSCQSGGWVDGNFMPVPIQMAGTSAAVVWSLAVTYMILFFMNKVPCLRLALDATAQETGCDYSIVGEIGYSFVEITSDGNKCMELDEVTPNIKQGLSREAIKSSIPGFMEQVFTASQKSLERQTSLVQIFSTAAAYKSRTFLQMNPSKLQFY